jgi:hypothetical protein
MLGLIRERLSLQEYGERCGKGIEGYGHMENEREEEPPSTTSSSEAADGVNALLPFLARARTDKKIGRKWGPPECRSKLRITGSTTSGNWTSHLPGFRLGARRDPSPLSYLAGSFLGVLQSTPRRCKSC